MTSLLADLITIKHGYAFKGEYFRDSGDQIVLTPGNFHEEGGFRLRPGKEKFYAGPIPSDYVLTQGDVIVAMTEQGEGLLGSTAIVPRSGQFLHNQRLGLIRPKEGVELDLRFIYYLFNTRLVRQQIRATASGAKVRHTSPSRIGEVKAPIPSIDIQRRIASILSAYDNLIENNTRRIAILEEMARRIYEEWFVRFRFPGHEQVKMVESELGLIPEGWGVGCLCDVFDNVRQSTKPGEHLRQRRYVPIDCIGRRTLVLPETRPYEEAQSSLILFETDDILFGAMRPYFHKVAIAPCAGVTRTTCFVLRAKNSEFGAYGTMLAFSDPVVAYASAHTQGATIPYAVWDGSLANYAIPIPPESLLRQFNELVQPMLMWLRRAMFRQENLRATRDLLLPKLISGELDVSTLSEPEEAIAA